MSEGTGSERDVAAPSQEPSGGRLLPRWFTAPFYVVFTAFCIYSSIHVARSLIVQRGLAAAIGAIKGDLGRPALALDGPEGQTALGVLKRQPVLAFLYLNQALLQKEEQDARMARTFALRKALDWGTTSARREVIERILAGMDAEGNLKQGFSLDDDMRAVLDAVVRERRADPEMTYVEDRVTDAVDWLAKGLPGKPSGTEKRRLAELGAKYQKARFGGAERKALELIRAEWESSSDPARREAAAAFSTMLAGGRTALPDGPADACAREADRCEGLYRDGMVALAQASRMMVEQVLAEGRFLDHPHIYQFLSLLSHRFDEVRKQVADGAWALRHDRFTIRFLSYFATRATVNPFLVVETARHTREENERELRHANVRSMREATQLLGRIGVDYIVNRQDYKLPVQDSDEFIRRFVVTALIEVGDQEAVADVAEQALTAMQDAAASRPAFSVLFEGLSV